MDLWILYEIMCIWTMLRMSMVCKPRVLIGFYPNPIILESKLGKSLRVQEKHGILPLRLDSWFKFK